MGELDEILRRHAEELAAAAAGQAAPRVVTLTVTNPTERELRRLRLQVQTINSHKAPGLRRARLEGA